MGVVDTWLAYTISDVVGRTVCETPIVSTNSNVETYISTHLKVCLEPRMIESSSTWQSSGPTCVITQEDAIAKIWHSVQTDET